MEGKKARSAPGGAQNDLVANEVRKGDSGDGLGLGASPFIAGQHAVTDVALDSVDHIKLRQRERRRVIHAVAPGHGRAVARADILTASNALISSGVTTTER